MLVFENADEPAEEVDAAWIDEIESRADALEHGKATAEDWKVSLDRVRQELRDRLRP